jgi:hypothetical protein
LGSLLKWDTENFLGLMLINLVDSNPQLEWYVREMDIGRVYRRKELEDKLTTIGQSKENISSIINAFKRLSENPFGKILRFGQVTEEGDLIRTKCSVSDPRVVLYGLFKFAEKCNDYKEFTLATLLNDSIERDGVSPTRIFGFSREEMIPILIGLSTKYPEFITASFTHDLEKITLAKDKTSLDVLDLFKEEIKMDNKYREYFDIDEEYFPQINDYSIAAAGPDFWMRTYPHDTFIDMLSKMERVLARLEKRSLWIEGAYGTGKSQCAYTLKKILEVPEEELRIYWNRYEALKEKTDLLEKLIGHKQKGIVTVHRYASGGIDSPRALFSCFTGKHKKCP